MIQVNLISGMRCCEKHGLHREWHRTRPYGHHRSTGIRCSRCERERYHARKDTPEYRAAREAARERAARPEIKAIVRQAVEVVYRRRAVETLEQIESGLGERFLAEMPTGAKVVQFIDNELRARIGKPNAPIKYLLRMKRLSALLGQSLLSTSWSCSHCGVVENDPWFFEIDHIIPCAVVGKRSRRHDNLQVLCPNCHKRKTRAETEAGLYGSAKRLPGEAG